MQLPDRTIFDAVLTGSISAVYPFLRPGSAAGATATLDPAAGVAAKNAEGRTPLHIAAMLGFAEASVAIIQARADVSAVDNNGDSPLHLAAANGHWRAVRAILQQGAHVDQPNTLRSNNTPLFTAVSAGRIAAARVLLQHGASVNAVGEDGMTCLHAAAAEGDANLRAVRLLLQPQWGANVNAVEAYSQTPLAIAINHSPGDVWVVNVLLAHATNMLVGIGSGSSLLERAAELLQFQTVDILLQHAGAALPAAALALAAFCAARAEIDHDGWMPVVQAMVRKLMRLAEARDRVAAWNVVFSFVCRIGMSAMLCESCWRPGMHSRQQLLQHKAETGALSATRMQQCACMQCGVLEAATQPALEWRSAVALLCQLQQPQPMRQPQLHALPSFEAGGQTAMCLQNGIGIGWQ